VGRGPELALVDAAVRAARAGRGSLTVVTGEAGIGKTRLGHEAVATARDAGLLAVSAAADLDQASPPLWPWPAVVRQLCGHEAADLLVSGAAATTIDPGRYDRFLAVTDLVVGACRRRATVVVVDDIHACDADALLLTRFIARAVADAPLALVLTRRQGLPSDDAPRRHLVDELAREATPVSLQGLDRQETAALLAGHGWHDAEPDLVDAIQRLTDGNPLFLGRLAALGPRGALPAGVGLAIEEAVAGLDPGVRTVLRSAAVLGPSPTVGEATVVAAVPAAQVLAAVAAGGAAGLVVQEGPDRFRYTHGLVRDALEAGLEPGSRLGAHRRAVSAVAPDGSRSSPERLARRAHHAVAAAPRSPVDAAVAVDACRAAAGAMVDGYAYERADHLLATAVGLHASAGLGRPPSRLLVEWARSALRCGRLAEARTRFDRAASVAAWADDVQVRADVALGLGGHWLDDHRDPVDRARVAGLQRAALAALPPSEATLRGRLRIRLAAEAVYDGAPVERVLEALEDVRRLGDSEALAEALSLCHHALLTPRWNERRLAMADELVRVASEAGDGLLALMGLCWRTVDLFLLGDARSHRALEDLRIRAATLGCRNISYVVAVLDVMLLIRAGHLAEAEDAAGRCHELGVTVGEVDALAWLGAHLLVIRWIQGRDAELSELADEVAASPTLVDAEFTFRATSGAIAARAGRRERAQEVLDGLTVDGLDALPLSSTWLTGMVAIVDIAAALGDEAVAGDAYRLLTPYAAVPTMPSLAVVCLGSTERALGVAALTTGDVDAAVAHQERAVVANRRLGNRPLTAIAEADLADALLRRDRPGDGGRAAAALASAIATADALGMPDRADAWRKISARLAAPTRRGTIGRQGRHWRLTVDDRTALVPDRIGLSYLAELVTHPRTVVPALVLVGGAPGPAGAAHHELIDPAARTAYTDRARVLAAEIAAADADHDLARAERLRLELDFLVDQLSAGTGLGGRGRAFADEGERARTAVRKAIVRALEAVGAADPVIGRLLRDSVRTGALCEYAPGPDDEIVWTAVSQRG